MSAPRRLTPDQIAHVKRIAARQRRIRALLGKLPTTEKLAEELHVSPRLIERVSCDWYGVRSTGNKSRLDEAFSALSGSYVVSADI
jgi:AraC-like DNA-binding protein